MKKTILRFCLIMTLLPLSSLSVSATPEDILLEAELIDPTNEQGGPQRSPVLVPEVSIEGHTLLFGTPCDGCTLLLLNEDGDVAYSTVIPTDTVSLCLPSTLSGDYEIRIFPGGSFYFIGIINL